MVNHAYQRFDRLSQCYYPPTFQVSLKLAEKWTYPRKKAIFSTKTGMCEQYMMKKIEIQ